MSHIDAETAVISLYENESLTGDLTDVPAKTLLKWGEAQVIALTKRHTDPTAFDADFTALRHLMRTVNHLMGNFDHISAEERQVQMGKIVKLASELNFTIQTVDGDAFLKKVDSLEVNERVRALIETIDPPEQPDPLI